MISAFTNTTSKNIVLEGDIYMTHKNVFTEIALVDLAMQYWKGGKFRALVGGLGLGYTTRRLMDYPVEFKHLYTVEKDLRIIKENSAGLNIRDYNFNSCVIHGDFFEFLDKSCNDSHDVILMDLENDVDSPLSYNNGKYATQDFYDKISSVLTNNGVFAMWSLARPNSYIEQLIGNAFTFSKSYVLPYDKNHREVTIYIGVK